MDGLTDGRAIVQKMEAGRRHGVDLILLVFEARGPLPSTTEKVVK